jgi:alanyl-tRNA synthetase
MPASVRLYYDDPTLLAFDATVRACEPAGERHRIALDRTAFYPTSGGQPHDVGHLRVADRVLPVSDVTSDDEEVWHYVRDAVTPGAAISGAIDGMRRQDFRQQHSAQHILSASFEQLCEARTESVHLGEETCTLDLHREASPDECRRAEDDANAIVFDNRPVTIRHVDAADLASEPRLRKMTARDGTVRLIDIAGHDLSACGGTHVSATGEIGLIVIRATERFRGGTRVTFLAGRRALASHRVLRDTADAAARTLSVAATDVPDALLRMRDDLKQEQRRASEAIQRATVLQAEALAGALDPSGLLVAELPAADAQALRISASTLVSEPGRVVALLGGPSPHALVIARSADRTDVDAGALVRTICAAHGGKGGGRPDLAQAGGVTIAADALRAAIGNVK